MDLLFPKTKPVSVGIIFTDNGRPSILVSDWSMENKMEMNK